MITPTMSCFITFVFKWLNLDKTCELNRKGRCESEKCKGFRNLKFRLCLSCFRDWQSAGPGDSGCVHEPADVSSWPAAPLSLSAESDSRPQPAEPHSPAALLAPPLESALHGRQPADLFTARSVSVCCHSELDIVSRAALVCECVCVFQIWADHGSCSLCLWTTTWT